MVWSATRQVLAGSVALAALLCGTTRAQEGAAPHPAPAAPPQVAPPSKPTAPAPPSGSAKPAASVPAGGPTEEEVAIALADLERAATAEPAERAAAVARNAGVASPKVVKALARFLKDKESAVRIAAFDALGRTAHADALKELHRELQSDAKLRDDPKLLVALLKAIGRHADPESVKILADNAWKTPDASVVQARLFALGNIRTKASVAQLMDLMNTDPTTPFQSSPYMADFRVALAALTGTDQGLDKDLWRTWWRDAEKTLKFGKDPPRLPDPLQSTWHDFWKLPPKSPATASGGATPPAH